MAETTGADSGDAKTIVIKKYANRRLYNTDTSSYVTLDDLAQMVRDGKEFVVRDAKSGDDITHQVLTQIIVDQEARGHNLLPLGFLRQLIRLYDDNLHAFVPRYLEDAMETFARHQDRMREQMDQAFGGTNPVNELERMGRQNVALVQRAMEMFTPFANGPDAERRGSQERTGPQSAELDALRKQLEEVQAQLNELSRKSPGGGERS